jgi:hypothetical protein
MRWLCLALTVAASNVQATTDAIRISVGGAFHKYGGAVTAVEPATAKTTATLYFTSASVMPIGSGFDKEMLYDTISWTVVYTDPQGTRALSCVGNAPAFDGTYFHFHVECDAFPH